MDGFEGAALASDSPPSEAWLFAQSILGKPIPDPYAAARRARQQREQLERLADFSPRHAEQLRKVELADVEARQSRASLVWAAGISARAEAKLRALSREEDEAREAQLRWERYYADYLAQITEWDPQQPRQPKGTSQGGQWVAQGGGGDEPERQRNVDDAKPDRQPRASDPRERYLADFDRDHDLTLLGTLKSGRLSAGSIVRIKFTDDEIKQILNSAKKPGLTLNLTFYTAQNLSPRLRANAEQEFANLPGDEKYAMQAFVSNQRRARTILLARNPAFQQFVGELYDLLRGLNPAHFMVEKGVVVATGEEPVLGGEASRLDALKDMLIYLLVMKGIGWGVGKISAFVVGPEAAGEITITFDGGGKLTIRRGVEFGSEALENAVERAAAGEKVEINPPPKLPRPSLTEVPRITDTPHVFRSWFNELTPDEFSTVWSNPRLRDIVEKGLRWPGRQHEWLMVGRAPKFKDWGITAEQIAEMRTPISTIRFKNPPGGHKGSGSATTHNEILGLIDSSPDFATFKARLQKWASNRLEGGAGALPPGLRP